MVEPVVVWEVEPGRRVLPAGSLPDVVPDGFDPPEGTVNLVGLFGVMSMFDRLGRFPTDPCQAAVAVPVTSVQVVNRSVISRRYSWADSR